MASWSPGGLRFQKTIVLDQTLKTEGGDTLLKGSYEVRFESLPGNRVRATFFQGGVKRGEAQGIIIIGGAQAASGAGPSTHMLGTVGFGPYYFFRHEAGKHHLVVGQQGANQIQIRTLTEIGMPEAGGSSRAPATVTLSPPRATPAKR